MNMRKIEMKYVFADQFDGQKGGLFRPKYPGESGLLFVSYADMEDYLIASQSQSYDVRYFMVIKDWAIPQAEIVRCLSEIPTPLQENFNLARAHTRRSERSDTMRFEGVQVDGAGLCAQFGNPYAIRYLAEGEIRERLTSAKGDQEFFYPDDELIRALGGIKAYDIGQGAARAPFRPAPYR